MDCGQTCLAVSFYIDSTPFIWGGGNLPEGAVQAGVPKAVNQQRSVSIGEVHCVAECLDLFVG